MKALLHLAIALLLMPTVSLAQATTNGATERTPLRESQESTAKVLRDFDSSVDEVAERVAPAVVQIMVSGLGSSRQKGEGVLERQKGIASGVIVDANGYIITNSHVVAGARRIRVLLTPIATELIPGKTSFSRPPRTYEATLIGTNKLTDLALLKIDEKGLPFLPLRESFRLRLGQTVLAIGSPEGLTHTLTMGIVSAPGRQPDLNQPMVYVQTDAAINPGNSGGALVDRDGNLAGINTFIYSRGGGSEGLGFAIPEPTVRFVYEELKQHGRVRRNVIGANAQTITPTLAAGLKLSQDWGVIISDVLPNGPAEKAGLFARDIVTAIDGVPIDSLPKFTARLYLHPHDRPVSLTVQRGAKQMQMSVVPVDVPTGVENLADVIDPQNSLVVQLGLFVLDMDKAPENTLPEMRSASGVIVVGKNESAPSLETDIDVGDVIQAVNGMTIKGVNELRAQLAHLKPGDAVVLRVERQGMYQFVPFEME